MQRSPIRPPVNPWLSVAALVSMTLACGGAGTSPSPTPTPTATPTPTPAPTLEVRVTRGQTYQRISGFGGSSAWHTTPPSETQADQLWSAENGAGLSLHRIRIAPDGTTWELSSARQALARGARIWAAPWSPPGAWKSNGSDTNGGRLLPDFYDDWASRLASFVAATELAGVPLAYLSVQNEPTWAADWETCIWTPAELLSFVRDHLGPTLAARDVRVPLLLPESQDWNTLRPFADPILADDAAAAYVGVIAAHNYGGSPFAYTTPFERGKEFWETEWSTVAQDGGMGSGLEVAGSIHACLTTANVNAWHYWWVTDSTVGTSGGLIQSGVVTKRLWVMGNYSKFVRPGSVRVAAQVVDVPPPSYVSFTAFRHDAAGRLIVVAVNRGTVTQPIHCTLTDTQVDALEPWVTSGSLDLARQASLAGGTAFSYELPPQSVTTFVGGVR